MKKMRLVSIFDIRESGKNELIYHPINPDDPEIIELAESIKRNGLLKNLVISEDGYILDGHRRRVACELAGVKKVRCEIKPVRIDDPEFMVLLREYNRQRVKGVDEVIREEIIDDADDGEAGGDLLLEQIERSEVSLDPMEIAGTKRRAEIKGNRTLLDAAIKIIFHLREFWPLSDRTIHYRLLNDPPLKHCRKPDSIYKNDGESYNTLTNVLTRGRLNGEIPWESIGDETRPIITWNVHSEVTPFIRKNLDSFMKGYFRDYMQSQPNQIEIVGEKLTIEGTLRPVAMKYCIPYTIGRGYSSINPRYEMAERFRKSGKTKLVVLFLTDFDPDGEEIAQSFARSMRDDFGINIHPIMVAVTRDQVMDLKLPAKHEAKKTSSNYSKFITKHGKNVFELEAIEPRILQDILTQAIEATVDVDLFNAEAQMEKDESLRLEEYRKKAMESLAISIGERR